MRPRELTCDQRELICTRHAELSRYAFECFSLQCLVAVFVCVTKHRKRALQEVDGWSAWCITEDTELGLKLFEAGHGAAYVAQSMGSGLIPDSLEAFQSQRYRWVYGAMQIMKRHAGAIFLGRTRLSWAQRYQFLSGWLP